MTAPFAWLPDNWGVTATWIYGIIDVLLRLTAIVVVPRNRRPGSAMAWLLAIMVLPLVGFPLYLLLGKAELPRKRRAKQRTVNRLLEQRAREVPAARPDPSTASWLTSAVRLNEKLGALPLTGHNQVELVTEYDESIARMTADVRAAKRQVHVLFYTMGLDDTTEDFLAALGEAADRGVTVRVLYDHLGSITPWRPYRRMKHALRAHGIEHYAMMPVKPFRDGAFQRPDLRNHRKMVVVDAEVGWMGSQNMIAPHYDKRANIRRGLRWQETMARLRGPIVSELNLLFAADWFYESGDMLPESDLVHPDPDVSGEVECQLVPSGPGFVQENNLLLFNQLLYSAQRRVVAVSPYFVPDESMLQAFVVAAKRGVEVELFVCEIGDQFLVFHAQRSYYEELLEAGVRIHLYRPPHILHAKHLSIDDSVAVIGSSNMDIRSFLLDMECSLMVGGTDVLGLVREVEELYRSRSRELSLEEWRNRPWAVQRLDDICRLASWVV
ncbi:cardiolipin synthase [Brachybacterium sp. EF45031]|nr:cardiolipin synthase [Brachybacterium sillae]MCS6711407.1 cardiolipin synthase [Brachybacterium sillae]